MSVMILNLIIHYVKTLEIMKTENVLIYEEKIGYCIKTTEEKHPNVEITEEGRLFIGNKEVEDYFEHPKLSGKLPIRYVVRLHNGDYYGFEGGFDLIKDEDGSLFWYSGIRFKNLEDAFEYINAKLNTKDWIICLEEPMP